MFLDFQFKIQEMLFSRLLQRLQVKTPPPLPVSVGNYCLHCLLLKHLMPCTNFTLDSHKIIQHYVEVVDTFFFILELPSSPGNNVTSLPMSQFDLKHSF